MLTTDANGVAQFYASPAIFDGLIQDANQGNQGIISNLTVNTLEGAVTPYAVVFGATVTINGALGVTGWAFFGASVTIAGALGVTGSLAVDGGPSTFGDSVTITGTVAADDFDFDGWVSALSTVTGGAGTAASPWEDWQDALGESTTTFFPAGYYKVTHGATMYNGCGVLCGPGATFLRDGSNLGVNVLNTGGVSISNFWISGGVFDNNSLAVSDFDIEITALSEDFRVERCTWKNLTSRAAALTKTGAAGTGYTSRFLWTRNDVQGTSNMTTSHNSFQFFSVSEFETSHNRVQGWGALKHENLSAGNSRHWKILYNKFYDVDQTCIFARVGGGHVAHAVDIVGNAAEHQYEMTQTKSLLMLGGLSGGSGGTWRGVYCAGNHAKGRLGHGIIVGDPEGGSATPVYNATVFGNMVDGRLQDDSTLESGGRGLFLPNLNNSIVCGNAVSYVARSGILLGGAGSSGSNVNVSGNYVEFAVQTNTTSPTPAQEAAITVWQTGSGVNIANNLIRNPGNTTVGVSYIIKGIYCDGGGDNRYIRIASNHIVDDRATPGMQYGIQVGDSGKSTPDVNVCTDNVVIGASTAAVLDYVSGSTTQGIYGRNTVPGSSSTISTAAALPLPVTGDYFFVVGSTAITSLPVSWAGRRVTLGFSDSVTVTDGAAAGLMLAGNFSAGVDDTMELVCNGTSWYETSRSAN
jgi:hypothetical protein